MIEKEINNGQRYLVRWDTNNTPALETDILIIGSGIAGLSAALEAANHGRVMVVSKNQPRESNTFYAQGGIATVLSEGDTLESHIEDTIKSGHDLGDREIIASVIQEGPKIIKRILIEGGANFDRQSGELLFTKEGGHSKNRILHAGGDATGSEIEMTLLRLVRDNRNIMVMPFCFSIDLISDDGRCYGALIKDPKQELKVIWAKSVILATGGAGQVYRESTNPEIATGDGLAMAFRAGAAIQDMEFFQFHPTTLYLAGVSRTLISEAVRGEGATLVDRYGYRFMPDYHELAELAPRDEVSRAILSQTRKTHDSSVYLDLRHLPAERVRERFPVLWKLCETYAIDITKDFVPVHPSAHYMIGGVKADINAATTLESLYAAGECAATTFHGANRLGSNSLLEGLVLGVRAGNNAGLNASRQESVKRIAVMKLPASPDGEARNIDLDDAVRSLKSLMWRLVGIEKDGKNLRFAKERTDLWSKYLLYRQYDMCKGWEFQNMLCIARLIIDAALLREESRGVHYREDFPQRDDKNWLTHIIYRNAEK